MANKKIVFGGQKFSIVGLGKIKKQCEKIILQIENNDIANLRSSIPILKENLDLLCLKQRQLTSSELKESQ